MAGIVEVGVPFGAVVIVLASTVGRMQSSSTAAVAIWRSKGSCILASWFHGRSGDKDGWNIWRGEWFELASYIKRLSFDDVLAHKYAELFHGFSLTGNR